MSGRRRHRSVRVARPLARAKRIPPAPKRPDVEIDWTLVAELRAKQPNRPPPPVTVPGSTKPRVVTGYCHTCGRKISGERWFCGPCLAKR